MRLLIMSDTHSDAEIITRVINEVDAIDAVFHCGDSELSHQHEALAGVHIVRGNCDWDEHFEKELVVKIEDETIFLTHGHLFQVKSSLLPISYRAKELQATLALFGHSHVLGAEMVDNILFVNPGSLLLPRGRKEKSYAIIEKQPKQWAVTFYTDAHQIIDEATFLIPKK